MSILATLSKSVNDVVDTVTSVQNTIRESAGQTVKNLIPNEQVGEVVDSLVQVGNDISTNVGETIKRVSSLVGESGDTLIGNVAGEKADLDDHSDEG